MYTNLVSVVLKNPSVNLLKKKGNSFSVPGHTVLLAWTLANHHRTFNNSNPTIRPTC